MLMMILRFGSCCTRSGWWLLCEFGGALVGGRCLLCVRSRSSQIGWNQPELLTQLDVRERQSRGSTMPPLQGGNDAPASQLLRCPTEVVGILCVLLLGSRGGGHIRGVGMRKTEVVSHRRRRGRDTRNGSCSGSRRQYGRCCSTYI